MESPYSSIESQQPHLPPGFRFHPTDEELVVYYLEKKAASAPLPVSIIADIDLYKVDPWELPAKATFGEKEWYFFSPRDRKYPNGARPNRAATSGYWKATGTDKPVLTKGGTQKVGVKKSLVFYGGKPPKGIKTNWIMHEYRLTDGKPNAKPPGCDDANKRGSLRLDEVVLCRIYKKHNTQRPIDQERDDMSDIISNSIPPTLSMHQLIRTSMLENEQALYEGMMSANNSKLPFMTTTPTNLLHEKSTLSNLYWNDANSKRFMSENCDGSSINGRPDKTNSIASILSQLPQTPATLEQQQAMLDGVFRQQAAYQVSGMNWYG